MAIRFWLFKSEPDAFSFDDLLNSPDQTTCWDGIRNYQARNFIRDDMKIGDKVLYYHSRAKPLSIVGSAEIVKEAYPDDTAFTPGEKGYDAKSDPSKPRWFMVDIKALQKFPAPVTREQLGDVPELIDMLVLKKGQRLSVQPVTEDEWNAVLKLAGL